MEELASLLKIVQRAGDLENKLDDLRKFKNVRVKELEVEFYQRGRDLPLVMRHLTDLADHVLVAAAELAKNELRSLYGMPKFQDNDGQFMLSDFAILGMGKLGGRELHFGSDLDLLFIFGRHGQTQGARVLSNQEYF